MPQPIIFFRKNTADYEISTVSITATEGSSSIASVLDRSNRSCWGTQGSVDANNTQIVVNLVDVRTLDSILLLKHNFASFKLEYWDDVNLIWVTIQSVSGITAASSYFSFASILTSQIRVTIYGTQVANSDKFLFQFIATQKIGQLNGWPVFNKPMMSRDIKKQQMLSGKTYITQSVGFWTTSLTVQNWSSPQDLAIVESLFDSSEGFLTWPCGGDESQFSSVRKGYRMEDIFLTRCANEWSPEWAQGFYKSGMKVQIDLIEVTT
jgi:hypothetical protein